eukprot:15483098-Alexandrium_andersonii.AAC.1
MRAYWGLSGAIRANYGRRGPSGRTGAVGLAGLSVLRALSPGRRLGCGSQPRPQAAGCLPGHGSKAQAAGH